MKYPGLFALIFTAAVPFVGAEECTRDQEIVAEISAGAIETWFILEAHHRLLGHCDDGAIAEGYRDTIASLLANRWEAFGEYSMGPEFESFILRHINETWPAEEWRLVRKLAAERCPQSKKVICDAFVE